MYLDVRLNSLFDSQMKVYCVTKVLRQCVNTKTTCHNYIFDFRNTKTHLLQVYLGAWIIIEIVINNCWSIAFIVHIVYCNVVVYLYRLFNF